MADTETLGDASEKMSTEDLTTEETPKEDITEEEMPTAEEEIPSKNVKEELLKEETEVHKPDSIMKETVDENGDVFEETTQVTRKVVKRTMKITETSSTTKTTTMTTPAKLYGKDLSEYDEVDVDALLAQLSAEEINILAKEVDPDDNFLPPNQRCSYECTKDPTGPLDRKKLIEHINKEALETPDLPEIEPFVKGTVRGKKWVPPPRDDREIAADEQIAIDMGEEYEHALSDATQEEIIDLAAILGFHSMMNQDQYHASLLNKGQPIGMGWDGITKSTTQKLYPMDPPNNTDVDESVKRVKDDDSKLIELNLNNIKNISDEKLEQLFNALPQNEHLEVLSLTNVGLTDKTALLLAEAIEKSKTLRVLNVETNFISPPVIVTLVKALLKARTIEEFRASNQRSTVLGNKIEMEITDLVEKNTSLLRLGLHLEFNDARHRVAAHLQRNIDRNEHEFRKGTSLSPIPKAASPTGKGKDLSAFLSKQNTKSPKPIHLVLTPQERIDSKSQLIASLESQKLSDHGKGEISVAVPQLAVGKKSPSMERKPSPKDKISPIKTKEPPKPLENKKTEVKDVEITVKKQSPQPVEPKTPHPLEESDVRALDLKKVPAAPYPSLDESVSVERISPTEVMESSKDKEVDMPFVKVPPTPYPSIDESYMLKTERPLEERKPSPTRNPKLSELRHSRLSRAFDQENGSPPDSDLKEEKNTESKNDTSKDLSKPTSVEALLPVSQPETLAKDSLVVVAQQETTPRIKENTTDKDVCQTPSKREEFKNEPILVTSSDKDIARTPSKPEEFTKESIISKHLPDDATRSRERLSESVSPSRHMEDKLTLLRAKIDSFAEVADEKMASLRSKFDDISREQLSQDTEISKPPSKLDQIAVQVSKPLPEEKIVKEIPEEPLSLPPKRPLRDATVPSKPLDMTPNSVGITLLFQQQIFTHMVVSDAPENVAQVSLEKVALQNEPPANLELHNPSHFNDNQIAKVSGELKQEPDILSTEKVQQVRDTSEQKLNPIDYGIEKIPESSTSFQEAIRLNPEPENPSSKNVDNPIAKESVTEKSVPISEPQSEPINLESLKAASRATALSLLSVKKRDGLSIDPISKKEAQTQSLPKPSPLLRLSVKKEESQKIDPVASRDAATQSLAKPNPMSLLSVKKDKIITIDPSSKSEVSTQFNYEKPVTEAESQTVEEDPVETLEDSTQTPLVFSSLEHDYIFPGLRRVPYLPRPKSINIGGGERVIVKPSSKPINEILMLLYPVVHDYSRQKETKSFGFEQDIIKSSEPDNTIKDLEDSLQKATEISKSIIKASPKPSEEPPKEEVKTSVRSEIEIPLVDQNKRDEPIVSIDECATAASEARFETKFTAVEKVSAITRTTIETEQHVEVIDKAYKSVAEVSTSEKEHVSKTSIRSANMWQALSSNLIKASEQTLLDLSKATEFGDGVPKSRSKIGKVSVYSSVEDLSRSKFSDRTLGSLIKTVETTSVYSSTEDIPYTKYSDRYKDGKVMSTASVYSSTEDLPQSSTSTYAEVSKPVVKPSVYSSTEDLPDVSYKKYPNRYTDTRALHYTADSPKAPEKSSEYISLLPRSKFSDRYKEDPAKPLETHRPHPQFPISYEPPHSATKLDRSYYKSAMLSDHSTGRSHYKSTEELLQRSKIGESSTYEAYKSHDKSYLASVQSSISRHQSALRPYTYVPSSAYTDLSFDHVRARPTSPSIHTATLQLNISPSGISELPQKRTSRYTSHPKIDKPAITISRVKDDVKSFRAISPMERSRPSKNLLSPYHKVSDQAIDDDSFDEFSQAMPNISSASTADNTTSTTESTKKRPNIMDTIKMLKNRVRDVITTEDRFTETHRLPSSP